MWVKHPTREADHRPASEAEFKCVAPQFHPLPYRIIAKLCIVFECTVRYGEWQSTALFGSAPISLVNSGVDVK